MGVTFAWGFTTVQVSIPGLNFSEFNNALSGESTAESPAAVGHVLPERRSRGGLPALNENANEELHHRVDALEGNERSREVDRLNKMTAVELACERDLATAAAQATRRTPSDSGELSGPDGGSRPIFSFLPPQNPCPSDSN